MKVLLIDTEATIPQIIETPGGLDEWRRLIGCHRIDIAYKQIGGKYFDIIIYDEGLYQDRAKTTALDSDKNPVLVGSLVICNYDGEGGETSLTADDIRHLHEHLVVLTEKTEKDPERWLAVTDVEP